MLKLGIWVCFWQTADFSQPRWDSLFTVPISPPKYLKPTPTRNTSSATPSPSPIREFSDSLIKFNEAASEVDDKLIKISP